MIGFAFSSIAFSSAEPSTNAYRGGNLRRKYRGQKNGVQDLEKKMLERKMRRRRRNYCDRLIPHSPDIPFHPFPFLIFLSLIFLSNLFVHNSG
jgi:hypothetical protein